MDKKRLLEMRSSAMTSFRDKFILFCEVQRQGENVFKLPQKSYDQTGTRLRV